MNTPIKKKVKKNPTDRPHYVDNKLLFEKMKEHLLEVKESKRKFSEQKSKVLELPRVSEYIGECIFNIAKRLSNSPNFINYPFKDEMISDGIENCLLYLNNFNPEKYSNPFAYFTQIIYYAFIRRIQKEKRYLYAKFKAIEKSIMHEAFESEFVINNTKYGNQHSDEMMHQFLENFEEKAAASKIKKDKKAVDYKEKIKQQKTTANLMYKDWMNLMFEMGEK